jgi:hypothetical protein
MLLVRCVIVQKLSTASKHTRLSETGASQNCLHRQLDFNYGVLVVWWLVFLLAHDGMYRLHGRWFHRSVEQCDALHYAGMALFKIGMLLFNLVPSIALRIVG